MKKTLLISIVFSLLFSFANAQNDSIPKDAKTGLNIGGIPVVAFDSDLGFQYGALANLYFYGNGSTYPEYRHSLYFEWSRYTKGSGINRFFYDSKYLIPNIRVTADISYLTEQALNFYGFNGYQAVYNSTWEQDLSRMYYRYDRSRFRLTLDLQGKLKYDNLRWIAGIASFNDKIASVDIAKMNEGNESDLLPTLDSIPGLFENYIAWGIIPDNEKNGGMTNYLKFGVVYDSRDNEPNPMSGIWTEATIVTAPGFIGNKIPHTKLNITHRQYFTVIKNDLSFAYRLSYQQTIAGHTPFYMQSNVVTSFLKSANSDGLGGSKTLRGIVRNRIVGDGIAYGNAELRWKFLHFKMLKQNIYLGLNGFVDAGLVTQEIDIDKSNIPAEIIQSNYFNTEKDKLHIGLGAGFRFAMNQNFIIAVDYGLPLEDQDGKGGLYIGLNYLF